jgi:hypothetical protein
VDGQIAKLNGLRRYTVQVTSPPGAECRSAKLKKLEASPRPEEIPPAEARVKAAQAEVKDAEVQVRLIESVTDTVEIRHPRVGFPRLPQLSTAAELYRNACIYAAVLTFSQPTIHVRS